MLAHKFKRIGYISFFTGAALAITILSVALFSGKSVEILIPTLKQYKKTITKTVTYDPNGIKEPVTVEKKGTEVNYEQKNVLFLISDLLQLIGLSLIVLSKEKTDDERMERIRFMAFQQTFMVIVGMGVFYKLIDFIMYKSNSPSASSLIMLITICYMCIFRHLRKKEEANC